MANSKINDINKFLPYIEKNIKDKASIKKIYEYIIENSNFGDSLILNAIIITASNIGMPYTKRQVNYFENWLENRDFDENSE